MSQEMSHLKNRAQALPSYSGYYTSLQPNKDSVLCPQPTQSNTLSKLEDGSRRDKSHRNLQAECLEAGRNSKVNSESVTLIPVVSMEGMQEVKLAAASAWVHFLVEGKGTVDCGLDIQE